MTTLVFFLGCTGMVTWLWASVGSIPPWGFDALLIVQIAALFLFVQKRIRSMLAISTWSRLEQGILLTIVGLFALYAIGVVLPEVGFDALWYHLPIIHRVSETGKSLYIPELYQSAQPRLGAVIFVPIYHAFGVVGAKAAAYVSALLVALATYALARTYLRRDFSLLCVLVIVSFHTLSWQSASVYVDLIRTVFECAAVMMIFRKQYAYAGIFLGFSLLTKSVSIFFFPAFCVLLVLHSRSLQKTVLAMGIAIAMFIPSQLQGYQWIGRIPMLAITTDVSRDLIGATYLQERIVDLITLPVALSFHQESYTSPLFLFALPFVFLLIKTEGRKYISLLAFIAVSYLLWNAVIPVSVRYDLIAFIMYTIICLMAIERKTRQIPYLHLLTLIVLFAGVGIHTIIRGGAVVRALPYLTGTERAMDYVRRFDSPIIHGPLEKWYGGQWDQ